jgi:hypothetical protein
MIVQAANLHFWRCGLPFVGFEDRDVAEADKVTLVDTSMDKEGGGEKQEDSEG